MFFFIIERECESEIKKLKLAVEDIKKVSAKKDKPQPNPYESSDMDELDSLFSLLEGPCSSSSVMPTPAAGHNLMSPPPLPPDEEARPHRSIREKQTTYTA